MIWKEVVRRIANGLPVDESVTNVPIDDLTSRTVYLKEVLEAFQAGKALTHQDAPLSDETFVGCVVYWDEANAYYAPGLATYEGVAGNILAPSAEALALGVVVEKIGNTGTVCLVGKITGIDITNAIDGDAIPGIYYLSDEIAKEGMLTSTRPPLGVPVLYLLSETEFWVSPLFRSSTFEHKHYTFFLDSDPAGSSISQNGDAWEIDDPDSDIPGWLPADHATFDGKTIPTGAKFGYNMQADTELMSAWPPAPPEGAIVIRDGLDLAMGDCGNIVVVNRDGIWWMDDETVLPWDAGWTSIPGGDESVCHPDYGQLFIRFTGLSGLTDNILVLSATGELPIITVDEDDSPATTGHLVIKLADYTEETDDAPTTCISALTRTAKTVSPVVGGIRATGLATAVGTGSFEHDGDTYQKGLVDIVVTNNGDNHEGFVDLVELIDAQQADYSGVSYLSMPVGIESSIRCRFSVPTLNLSETPQATIILWVMATSSSGTLPTLELSARRAADPTDDAPIQSMPLADDISFTDLTPSGEQNPVTSWQYIKLESEPFDVEAGDTVIFKVTRAASDGYDNDLGIFIPRWAIS